MTVEYFLRPFQNILMENDELMTLESLAQEELTKDKIPRLSVEPEEHQDVQTPSQHELQWIGIIERQQAELNVLRKQQIPEPQLFSALSHQQSTDEIENLKFNYCQLFSAHEQSKEANVAKDCRLETLEAQYAESRACHVKLQTQCRASERRLEAQLQHAGKVIRDQHDVLTRQTADLVQARETLQFQGTQLAKQKRELRQVQERPSQDTELQRLKDELAQEREAFQTMERERTSELQELHQTLECQRQELVQCQTTAEQKLKCLSSRNQELTQHVANDEAQVAALGLELKSVRTDCHEALARARAQVLQERDSGAQDRRRVLELERAQSEWQRSFAEVQAQLHACEKRRAKVQTQHTRARAELRERVKVGQGLLEQIETLERSRERLEVEREHALAIKRTHVRDYRSSADQVTKMQARLVELESTVKNLKSALTQSKCREREISKAIRTYAHDSKSMSKQVCVRLVNVSSTNVISGR